MTAMQSVEEPASTIESPAPRSEVQLTVVLPTLNEAGNIGPLLDRLAGELRGLGIQIVVVDDGSTDGTVQEIHDADSEVDLIRRDGDAGLATAVLAGMEAAEGRYVVVMDSDGQHPAETIPRLFERAEQTDADLVLGSRYVERGSDGGLNSLRKVVSSGAQGIAYAALPSIREHGITDPMTGLFLVQRSAVDTDALSPRGYKILLEILVRGDIDRVEEVGYAFQEREEGESKLGADVVVDYLAHVGSLSLAEPLNRRLSCFTVIGASGILVNLSLLVLLTEIVGLPYMASAAIAVEASILSNWALNDVSTFRDRRSIPWYERLARFNLVGLLALVTNLSLLALLTEGFGIHYVVSAIVAIGAAFATNWLANLSWAYPETTETDPAPPGSRDVHGQPSVALDRVDG
jgi:dolichol-phosphate mannosyltransferase